MADLQTMYSLAVGDRTVALTASYHAGTDTSIQLDSTDAGVILPAPNRATVTEYDDDGNITHLVTILYSSISGTTQKAVNEQAKTAIAGKQNLLTFDSTPTEGSTNPVTSGGVYAASAGANVVRPTAVVWGAFRRTA